LLAALSREKISFENEMQGRIGRLKKGIQGQKICFSNPFLQPAATFPSPRDRPIEPDGKRCRKACFCSGLIGKNTAEKQ
jgi:hypothetical protein